MISLISLFFIFFKYNPHKESSLTCTSPAISVITLDALAAIGAGSVSTPRHLMAIMKLGAVQHVSGERHRATLVYI